MKDYTPYGTRPPKPEPIYRHKVCVCGHNWVDHDSSKPEQYKGFLHWLGCSMGLIFDGPCRDCACPCYDELGEFTNEELYKLKEESLGN